MRTWGLALGNHLRAEFASAEGGQTGRAGGRELTAEHSRSSSQKYSPVGLPSGHGSAMVMVRVTMVFSTSPGWVRSLAT